jgi:hypothetical protein
MNLFLGLLEDGQQHIPFQTFDHQKLAAEVVQAELALISQAKAAGGNVFFSLNSGSLNLPGLFTGKAGVALALLKAATGEQWMPQVLNAVVLQWTS